MPSLLKDPARHDVIALALGAPPPARVVALAEHVHREPTYAVGVVQAAATEVCRAHASGAGTA